VPERGFLSLGTRVGLTTFLIETALVADTDGVLVVVAGMGPDEILMTGLINLTITGDVVMVAGEAETGLVTGYQVFHGEGTVAARRAAMHD